MHSWRPPTLHEHSRGSLVGVSWYELYYFLLVSWQYTGGTILGVGDLFILRHAEALLPEPQAEDAAGPSTAEGLQHSELPDVRFSKVMAVPGCAYCKYRCCSRHSHASGRPRRKLAGTFL